MKRNSSVGVRSENNVKDDPSNSIEVIVRMRPLLEPYEDEVVWEVDQETNTIRAKVENVDLKSLNLSHPKYYSEFASNQKFVFDNVEGMQSRTKDIYNKKLKKITDSVVQGYNGTIFMYGQTSSGKTFTMLGTQKEPGLLPHSLRTIFMTIPKMENYSFKVYVSYLEIYNEVVNDLLVPGSTNLKVVDDPKYGVTVRGLKRQEVSSFDDAVYLMSYGEEHRKYRETNANEHSSRSHTIYQVFIESFQVTENNLKKRRFSILNLVDLAGSERLSDNGGNDSQTGETGHINKSLFLLTNVIKRLADGKTSHIPYRDSKLTRILSNAVGGNSLTTVICAISPALVNFGQTLSTLRFASRAKKVKNAAHENFVDEGVDLKLKEEVKHLREKLNQSQSHVTRINSLNVQLEENLHVTKQEVKNLQKEMEDLKTMFIKEATRQQLDDNLSNNSSLLDIMNDDVPQSLRIRSRTRVASTIQQPLYQSTELFFGDPILAMIEQVMGDSQSAAMSVSIDSPSIDNSSNTKEWSALCLKAKYNYLRELKNLQKNFVNSLEDVTSKFVSKEQAPELGSQIKGYVHSEFQKIDNIQSKISDYVKKITNGSLKDILQFEKHDENKHMEEWLPREQHEKILESPQLTKIDSTDSDNKHVKYGDVLERLEKKYEEIYNLVTQSFTKKEENYGDNLSAPLNVKKYSFDSSYVASDNPDSANNSMQSPDNSMMSSPLKSPDRTGDRRMSRRLFEGPNSIGKPMARFTSSFARLRADQGRNSIMSLVEDSDYGNAYLWGSGKDGRLGNGRFTNESTPIPIKDIKFAKIVCGYHNTFGVSQEGLVYGWGRNEDGQLGNGTNINAPIPINVTGFNKITIVDIACGWQHCLALSAEGYIFSWGCGDEGQLGHGDNFNLNVPADIKFFERTQVTKIACGHSQSAAITTEGTLYTWGHNSDYRLMNSNARSHFIPSLTELYKVKSNNINAEGLEVISISMGASHMSIVTKNGNVYTAGRGHEGQLGKKLEKSMPNVEVYKREDDDIPESAGSSYEEDEEVLCSYFTQVDTFNPNNRAMAASCGEKFTIILTEDNKLYSFGDAQDGCLGVETKDQSQFYPRLIDRLADKKVKTIVAGPRHVACITDKEELYCWGFNYYDQLDIHGNEKDYYRPKRIEKLSKKSVFTVSCGYFHTAAIVK